MVQIVTRGRELRPVCSLGGMVRGTQLEEHAEYGGQSWRPWQSTKMRTSVPRVRRVSQGPLPPEREALGKSAASLAGRRLQSQPSTPLSSRSSILVKGSVPEIEAITGWSDPSDASRQSDRLRDFLAPSTRALRDRIRERRAVCAARSSMRTRSSGSSTRRAPSSSRRPDPCAGRSPHDRRGRLATSRVSRLTKSALGGRCRRRPLKQVVMAEFLYQPVAQPAGMSSAVGDGR